MGKVHKIANEYYIEFYARGLLYQQKAGDDLKKAEELLASIEAKIANGEIQAIVREISIDVFFNEFLKHAKVHYHPHTIRRLQSTITYFESFLKQKLTDIQNLSQATPRVFEDFKTALVTELGEKAGRVNPKIVNLTILLLREILEYGIKIGYINDNPTLHIKLLVNKNKGVEIIKKSDVERILESSKEPYRSMFLFLRETGLRIEEIAHLTWQQVDFNRNVIFVKYREVPLNGIALTILKNAFERVIDHKAAVFLDSDGKVFEPGELTVRFTKAAAQAQLSIGITVASLRAVFASDLLNRRFSFLMLGKIMGIHDIAKLMRYASSIPLGREDICTGAYGA